MKKKIKVLILTTLLTLSMSGLGPKANASTDYKGKIVKMNGLSTLYYVAADGKRYVFPNSKIYNSWFSDFEGVVTLDQDELMSMSLGGNVLYRPGVLLVKITTDPHVYAVTDDGVLRWIKTEEVAEALYGENWNKLVDDVPDSFFTNYTIGDEIDSISDFDPDEAVEETKTIDANFGMSATKAKIGHTYRCRMVGDTRNCQAGDTNEDDDDSSGDTNNEGSPYITKINVSSHGNTGYIDTDDEIKITFSEAIDPSSLNSSLKAGGYYASLNRNVIGSINVLETGVLTINNIASFDVGSIDDNGEFAVRMELDSSATNLTIIIIDGEKVKIENEYFDDCVQIGGTIKDASGNAMEDIDEIDAPTGSFGGSRVNDGIEPYITSIDVYNGGSDDHIDVNDRIEITFSEDINPDSVHEDLDEGESVENVGPNETGGITIDDDGDLEVKNILTFNVGEVDDVDEEAEFTVKLSLNSKGDILTITLTDGDEVDLDDEDLDDAEQIGDTIEDLDGNDMEDDNSLPDPEGSFLDNGTAHSNFYIKSVEVENEGSEGYIDEKDQIIITFNDEVNPDTIHSNLNKGGYVYNIEADEKGGVYVESNGILTVTEILSFEVGEVEGNSEFEVKLHLDSDGEVLTITITDGEAVEINDEDFDLATQIGGYVQDKDENVLDTIQYLEDPDGTFGGGSGDVDPYIVEIEIENGDNTGYIDVGDEIKITFNEGIKPESIHEDLDLDDDVRNVDDDDTGGVNVDDDGILTVSDIVSFYVGEVQSDEEYRVDLHLNSTGNVLTITLDSGDATKILDADLDDGEQIGGTIEDEDGNEMQEDTRIADPKGAF